MSKLETPDTATVQKPKRPPFNTVLRDIFASSGMIIGLAIILSLLIGALLVALFNPDVIRTSAYLFARPADFFREVTTSFSQFFTSLVRGAIFDYRAASPTGMFKPLMDSLTNSVPLIFAGLAVGVGFKAGLFNIGAQGQLIVGAIVGTFVGLNSNLPGPLHLLATIVAAGVGGAAYGFIPGYLKAKLGANEVIVTIMLNSIALYLLAYVLKRPSFIGAKGYPGRSAALPDSAAYPSLLGSGFRLHWGFILALVVAVGVWWVLERSTFGFELRAAGANPNAANTAGISTNKVIVMTMTFSGALAGLAATGPAMGTEKFINEGVAGSYGFDAITVALLGGSSPLGTVLAGILFGALNAAGSLMQASAGIPVDIVQVSQAVIVLLIAAPPLVRWIFRLPEPRDRRVALTPTPETQAPAKGDTAVPDEATDNKEVAK
ncbi:MAG: ABC transporter permease [Actinomycetaceae bacterium]|nr:ABC transporter permease [Actinomycetaceae bacterium]